MNNRKFKIRWLWPVLALVIPLTSIADYRPGYRVLNERTEIIVNADFTSTQVQSRAIKVLERNAVEYLGESSISFNSDHVRVEVLEAYVTRPDGSRVDVPRDSIKVRDEYVDEDAPIFSSQKKVYLLFPEVSVGSVITQKIKRYQHTPTFPGNFSWYDYASPYQPTDSSTYLVSYHPSVPLKFAVRGGFQPVASGEEHAIPPGYLSRAYRYEQKSFRPSEEGSVDLFDYVPMVIASTFPNWGAVAKAYHDRARDKATVTPEIRSLAARLTKGLIKKTDRVQALQQWVAQNIRYVGTYIGAGGFVPHTAQSVLDRRYGDCKDHVVLLEALLAAIEIKSTAALINLGDTYSLGLLPMSSPFNHVITYIPVLDLFVDSTAQYARTGTLPVSVMAKPTVLASTGEVRHTPSPSPVKDSEITEAKWEVMASGDMIGTAKFNQTGWFEVWARDYYSGYESTAKDRWIRNYLESHGEVGSGSQHPTNSDDWMNVWTITTTTNLSSYVNLPSRSAFRIPVGLTSGTLSEMVATNWPEKRVAPWRCLNRKIIDSMVVSVPPGVKIEDMPKQVSVKAALWEYRSSYTLQNNKIRIRRELVLSFKQPDCDPALAPLWKKFISTVRRDVRAQIFVRLEEEKN